MGVGVYGVWCGVHICGVCVAHQWKLVYTDSGIHFDKSARVLGRNVLFSVLFLKSLLRNGEGWKRRRMGKERRIVNNTVKTIT